MRSPWLAHFDEAIRHENGGAADPGRGYRSLSCFRSRIFGFGTLFIEWRA